MGEYKESAGKVGQTEPAKSSSGWRDRVQRITQAVAAMMECNAASRSGFLKRAFCYIRRLSDAYAIHQCGLMACACAYCALLSIVPLLVVGIAALGYIVGGSQTALERTLKAIYSYVPVDVGFLREILNRILEDRGLIGLFGLIGLLFAAHQVFLAMEPAMNIVWNVPETRHWLRQRLIALGATLATLLLFGGSLFLSAAFVYLHEINVPVVPDMVMDRVFDFAIGLLPLLLTTLLFAMLYRWLPACPVSWKSAFLGASVAAALWELTKIAFFRFYLAHFHVYDRFYGPLSALVIVTIWMYYSMAILLLGAEVAADYAASRKGVKAMAERVRAHADLTAAHLPERAIPGEQQKEMSDSKAGD